MPTRPEPASRPARLGILLSGGGTTMQNLAECIDNGTLDATIAQVIASNDQCRGIERAQRLGLPCTVIRRKDYSALGDRATAEFSDDVFALLREAGVEIVCLAGFLSLLVIPDDFTGRVLNIHPSLLPKYKGLDTHARALAAGDAEHGCSVHEVTARLDDGPILGQARVPILPGDTPDALAARVLVQEHRLYPAVLRRFAAGDRSLLLLD